MTECHVEWEKRTRDAAVQAQMSCDRTSKAPCQSSALLGIMQVLLDHMPPSRKGGVLLVGGFVNSSILWMYRIGGKTFDITFKSVLRLISGQVCKICDCWWKIFWPVEMMFTERSCIVVYLYRRTLQTSKWVVYDTTCKLEVMFCPAICQHCTLSLALANFRGLQKL